MATAEEILNYLGIPQPKDKEITLDDFKETFEKDYGKKEALKKDKEFISQITGKALGSVTTKLVTMFKENGVEIDKDVAEKNPIEAVAKIGFAKLDENHNSALETIKSKSGQKETDAIKELNEKLEKAQSERTQIEQMLGSQKKEHEEYVNKKEQETLGILTNHEYSRQFSGFKFKPDATPIVKKGFEAEFKDRYNIQYDRESGELIPTNKKGERIPNPEKNSTFKSFHEVLNDLGDELQVRDNNEKTRKDAPKNVNGAFGAPVHTDPPKEDGPETTGDGRFRIRRTATA